MYLDYLVEKEMNERRYMSGPLTRDYGDYKGDHIGNRSGAEARYANIAQTNDILRMKDMGRSTPEQREKWKLMGRRPNVEYYRRANDLTAHIRHLQSPNVYGDRISFFSYDNGTYIFYKLDGKVGYLKPNDPMGYEKIKGDPMR